MWSYRLQPGDFDLTVSPGCHVLVIIAPDGFGFEPDLSRYHEVFRCLQYGEWDRSVDAALVRLDGAFLGGKVESDSGPVAGVKADLFRVNDADNRIGFLGGMRFDNGDFGFEVNAGCYSIVLIAPDGYGFEPGLGRFREVFRCLDSGDRDTSIEATLAAIQTKAFLEGKVSGPDGPVPDVKADLFRATADGNRSEFLGAMRFDDGSFGFEVDAGCYTIVLISPDGYGFGPNTSRYKELFGCLDRGEVDSSLKAELRAKRSP